MVFILLQSGMKHTSSVVSQKQDLEENLGCMNLIWQSVFFQFTDATIPIQRAPS